MILQNLHLFNFKNYEELSLGFAPGINAITGANGSGKTNILDAIYFVCTTKSALHNNDSYSIRFGQHFFAIHANFHLGEQSHLVQISLSPEKGKQLKINKQTQPRMSDHIGHFPCVLISPYDTDLIREGSEIRRKFFDGVIAQLSPEYLQQLLRYNQLLRQRNALLKQFAERNRVNKDLLDVFDSQMIPLSQSISQTRSSFIEEYWPVFLEKYHFIADDAEKVLIEYKPSLQHEYFEQYFRDRLSQDLAAQYTTAGIHKDDFLFSCNGQALKKFGSQGQQKSMVIALKLAQLEIIRKQKAILPLLLLDDIFDKLDDSRISRLLQLMQAQSFGQVFITDARPERTKALFGQLGLPVKQIQIANGALRESN